MKDFPHTDIEIIKTWKSNPDIRAEYGNLASFEAACRWETNPALRAEFRSREAYIAFNRAETAGLIGRIN
ncbi:MAG: hypothetical protein ACR65R_19880 [Methylomicrobium sp.]